MKLVSRPVVLIGAAVLLVVATVSITYTVMNHRSSNSAGSNSIPKPAGYDSLTHSDFGQALATRKPGDATTQAAIIDVFGDLQTFFGARPTIKGAFDDARTHRNGGASFTAQYHGDAIKGFICCQPMDAGTWVTVVYCKADAPDGELSKLTKPTPPPANGGSAPPIVPPMATFQFPDGTGSIGMPAGWSTASPTCNRYFTVDGPTGQHVDMMFSLEVVTPDSMAAQFPAPSMLISKWDEPANVMINLMPQIASQQPANAPSDRFEKLISNRSVPAAIANGVAADVLYDYTETANGTDTACRCAGQIELDPGIDGMFVYRAEGFSAPRTTFGSDLPVMMAIANSLHVNQDVANAQSQQLLQGQNDWFAAQQGAHATQVQSGNEQLQDYYKNENIQDRSFADADEVIIGYRDMLDTHTDEKTPEVLGDITQIVEDLNKRDPGRYEELPLRDEMFPKIQP